MVKKSFLCFLLHGTTNSFFEDLEDEEEHAVRLFNQEVQKNYEEEEQDAASRNN